MSERLDAALVSRGLARSRATASAVIKAGAVTIDGKVAMKPSQIVTDSSRLIVTAPRGDSAPPLRDPQNDGWGMASRAGGKLEAAITELRSQNFTVNVAGKNCLDIGASTGGFTGVLLQNGAAKVIALDVGHGQLREELRTNPKVTVMERVNARYLTAEQLPYPPQFITCDVSFISLTMMFEPIRAVAEPGAQVLLLIKPQFEVGKGNLGKGGIVRDEKLIANAIETVKKEAANFGILVAKVIPSAVPGTNGNQEYFLFGAVELQ